MFSAKKLSVPQTGMGESAMIYEDFRERR
jgi:hypothetical protein